MPGLDGPGLCRRIRAAGSVPYTYIILLTATGGRERRLEGLADEPRPGAPRKITDADVERVVTRTLETKPKDATHWSTRGMAEAAGMSQTVVGRI